MKFTLTPEDRISTEEHKPKKKKGGWLIPLLAWSFGSLAILAVAGIFVVSFFIFTVTRDLPSAETLRDYQPAVTTRLHAADGTLLAEFAKERRLFVPLAAIPVHLQEAFLSAEDKNFYEHMGVDPQGILRAVFANIQNYLNHRRLEGASTITQQVARNFLLSSEISFDRKIKEALISLKIEQTFSKQHILELYLNEIYLGWRSYGVASAALGYFDKSLDELTVGEMAYLASLPKGPNNYHPIKRKKAAMARRNWVLERMEANGYITKAEMVAAQHEDLVTHRRPYGTQIRGAGYFAEEVRRQLYEKYDEDGLYTGGLSVRTTLDPKYQMLAQEALRYALTLYDQRHGWRGPFARIESPGENWLKQLRDIKYPDDLAPWKIAVVLSAGNAEARLGFRNGTTGVLGFNGVSWARPWLKGENVGAVPTSVSAVVSPGDVIFVGEGDDGALELKQIPAVNGAIIAMDPHTGRVHAMIGGFSFDNSEFNRATQAYRQPGSSFKPFVYAAALDAGYTPSTIVLDGPLVVDQGPGLPLWKPKNYSAKFYGESTLRVGIENSRNLMTARLALDIGMEPIVENARKFGIKEDLEPRPAMALGAGETTLYRMVTGYSIFDNGGKRVVPTLIDRIQDRYGRTIERHDKRICEKCNATAWEGQAEPLLVDDREQVVDDRTAYQVVSMLEGAVLRGTGTKMRSIGKPIAGKTGTTNDARDAWFIGMTPDLVVGAYVGFDIPRSLGSRETGGRVALPAVKYFMERALADKAGTPFRIPAGIRLVRVNRKTGLLTSPGDPQMILEAFKPGTEPKSNRGPQRLRLEEIDGPSGGFYRYPYHGASADGGHGVDAGTYGSSPNDQGGSNNGSHDVGAPDEPPQSQPNDGGGQNVDSGSSDSFGTGGLY